MPKKQKSKDSDETKGPKRRNLKTTKTSMSTSLDQQKKILLKELNQKIVSLQVNHHLHRKTLMAKKREMVLKMQKKLVSIVHFARESSLIMSISKCTR